MRISFPLGLAIFAACSLHAQQTAGWNFHGRLLGSANASGAVYRIDPVVGYSFNRYVGVDAGVPIYIVRPSDTIQRATGATPVSGLGNAYGALRFTLADPEVFDFLSILTVAAPTGDEEKGLSTGRVTVDWTNFLSKSFGRLRPFGAAGVANAITDTAFFVRPFFTHGTIGHFEGGADYLVGRRWGLGASAYSIVPAGDQTVVSRVLPPQSGGRGVGRAMGRPFENIVEQTGPSALVRDHGFSTWWQMWPSQAISLQAGYSRSMNYDLDSIFFGVGFNIGTLVKRVKH